jgi:hypothetical protein
MNLTIKSDCFCEGYLHELSKYPRPGLVEKKLKAGDIVELVLTWNNFYGYYVRVQKDGVIYDIKPENIIQ